MEGVFKRIQRTADPAQMSVLEQMHVPVIELPDSAAPGEMFAVTVKVGRIPHEMEPGHYVQFVDLYAGATFMARTSFTPTGPKPKATYYLALHESTSLRAMAFCNQDGFWESEHWINVR
jgi:superoxide reductase